MVGPYSYRLDTLGEGYNVFNVDLLRLASIDPFLSQKQDDVQPEPIVVEGHEEYHMEKILDERTVRKRGRGGP